MTPRRYSTVRHRSRSGALAPFRDDTSLIALGYEQTEQAEPPIPIVPARSSLRPRARASSHVSSQRGAPIIIPPPQTAPPAEEHPALRTTTVTYIPEESKRDSGHEGVISPPATPSAYGEAGDDGKGSGEGRFPYERVRRIPELQVATSISSRKSSLALGPREETCSPLPSPIDSQSSIPALSQQSSESNTISQESPTTPDFGSSKLARPFSFRSSFSYKPGPTASLLNIEKKRLTQRPPKSGPEDACGPPPLSSGANRRTPPTKSILGSLKLPFGSGRQASVSTISEDFKPIKTEIPTDSLLDDEFMNSFSFLTRASLTFGGDCHPHDDLMHEHQLNRDSGIDTDSPVPARSFPLVTPARPDSRAPSPSTKSPLGDHAPLSQALSSATVENANEKPNNAGSSRAELTQSTKPEASTMALDTPAIGETPPSIRLISVDAEKESQKVRSLYAFGEDLNWDDGGLSSPLGERLEPTAEVPSGDEDEGDVTAPPERHDQANRGPARDVSGRHSFPRSTLLRPDSLSRRDYERAGGIEDWEDVSGEDVDRYGFISTRRPDSRSSTPSELKSVQYSPLKHRNILVRRDPSVSGGLRRGPSRKVSARSLYTQASGVSTTSRMSARSAVRQAANLLPHNRDRKWMDAAGDILALQPGFPSAAEDAMVEKLTDELKKKEWQRAEKWRKMAKVVKPGGEGEGMIFEFDLKHPKLVERTWKGIPDRWRAAAWYSFLSSSARDSQLAGATEAELFAAFHRLQDQASPDDVQIDLDVPRTINQHIMFRRRYRGGQRLLFRVLHALSLYFPTTGYVQGMAALAATLLSYYDEERCFVVLVRLWELRGLNRLYQPGFGELMGALDDFEKHWLAGKDVSQKLSELCIDPTAYATRWYLTLFNLSIPFPAQLRVWDVFMLLGSSPPNPTSSEASSSPKTSSNEPSSAGLEILHATSAAIMDALREVLLDSDFENAMKTLTSWVPIKNEDMMMKVVQAEWKHHNSKKAT